MAAIGYYCPRRCGWEGAEKMPPGQACPCCSTAVETYAPDGNPSDRPASQHVALDQVAWLTARYETFARRIGRLVAEKQIAYGDSFRYTRDVLKLLFPRGIPVERYGDLLTITRIVDKLFRVANQKDYGGENPYEDIAGYAIRAACEDEAGVATTPKDDDQGPIDLV